MDLKEVKDFVKFILKLELDEFEFEDNGTRIYISKNSRRDMPKYENKKEPQHYEKIEEKNIKELKKEPEGQKITAPIVGIFYEAPAPGAEPFVKEGDIVHKGSTICIIEAMKIMNEIEAEYTCRILKRLVENGQPIEYGQPLFIVEPLS